MMVLLKYSLYPSNNEWVILGVPRKQTNNELYPHSFTLMKTQAKAIVTSVAKARGLQVIYLISFTYRNKPFTTYRVFTSED